MNYGIYIYIYILQNKNMDFLHFFDLFRDKKKRPRSVNNFRTDHCVRDLLRLKGM